MSDEINRSKPLDALERKLAGFTPASPRIERDRLMFLAGRASAERPGAGGQGPGVSSRSVGTWMWPALTGVLGATAAGLAMALVLRQEPREVIVYRDVQTSIAAATPRRTSSSAEMFQVAAVVTSRPVDSRVPADNYLRTREVAVRMGLDAIGSQQAAAGLAAPQTYGELLQGLMGSRQTSEGAAERRDNLSNM